MRWDQQIHGGMSPQQQKPTDQISGNKTTKTISFSKGFASKCLDSLCHNFHLTTESNEILFRYFVF